MVKTFAFLALMVLAAPLAAQESIGRVLSVRGRATVQAGDSTELATPGQHISEGDVIATEAASAIRLLMKDRSILDVGASSRVDLAAYSVSGEQRSVGIHVHLGRLWARVTKAFGGNKNFEVATDNAVAGVRGTEFVVDVADGQTAVTVVSGSVEVQHRTSQTSRLLGALDRGVARRDGSLEHDRVTLEEIDALSQDTRPEHGLDRDGAKDRQDDARDKARDHDEREHNKDQEGSGDEQGDRDRQRHEGRLDQLGGAGPSGQAPPVNLEPGSGETRVKGRVILRDPPEEN